MSKARQARQKQARQKQAKTQDDLVRELRERLDGEVDQALFEHGADVLDVLGIGIDDLFDNARAHMSKFAVATTGRQQARDLRRAAMYALLAASEVDKLDRKAGA